MDKPRPYVTAALICEKLLREKDETLTLVRVADRLQYSLQGFPAETKPMIQMNGLLSLKSGSVTGDHMIKLVSVKPNGQRWDAHSQSVNLLGNDHGVNIIMNINLGVDQDGLYWFDVLFDDEILTRIPLMITQIQAPQQAVQAG